MSMKVAENGTHMDVNGKSAAESVIETVTLEVGNGTEISANRSEYNVVESRSKGSEVELLSPSNGISGVELEGNGQSSPSSSMPLAETSNVAGKNRDAEPHDDSKKQPLVASTPLMVQRTSLFSCCGLFDVLTGSNR